MIIWNTINQLQLKRENKNIIYILTITVLGTIFGFFVSMITYRFFSKSIQIYLIILLLHTIIYGYGSVFYIYRHDFK